MSTQTPIASFTATTSTSSVTFANIPQTYTDLVLVASPTASADGQQFTMTFNSDTSSNYSATYLEGNGTSATSHRRSNQSNIIVDYQGAVDTTVKTVYIFNIQNYSNTTTYKTALITSRTGYAAESNVALYRSTSAITTITLAGLTFTTGSTFNLYGIDAELSAQAKAYGGDTIVTDGSYWYHTFYSSGTFTPTAALTADYLVVAGGGGGYVQGGGAGGLRSTVTATGGGGSLESALSLTAQAYTVTVGAGGIQGNSGTPGNGSNSSISGTGITAITSTGGGGTSSGGSNGNNGGSGGGAFNSGTAGTGTANQGFAGGAAPTSSAGGGGGGAGAVGSAGSGSTGGNGGNGVSTSISGSSIAYAGGGAGYGTGSSGTAGTGGGGTAGAASPTSDGTTNRGGGGGGNNAGNGGKGGSGIVIIRYAV